MGLSVGGNWWDQLGTSIGDSLIGMADPFGSLNPADPMARQNAIRSTVGAMGAGMLANPRKRPMEAFGSAFQGAQQQGQQNSMNMLNAQNLMLGMENQRKDMAWKSGERQNTLEARDAEEDRKKQMAEYVQQQLANPDIPQKNKANAMFFMAAGDYEKAYQALQPAQPDYMTVPKDSVVLDKSSGEFSTPPRRTDGLSGDVDFKDIMAVRKEIGDTPSVKTYSSALPIYQTMVDANKRNTKAADLNMVYGLAKIFDPNSVVREGEMVLVKDTSSLPDWLIGSIQSLNGGARLQPQTREAMLQEAQSRIQAYKASVDTDLERYRGMGGRYGINPADIMPQFPEQSPLPQQTFGSGGPYPGAHGQFNPADPLGIR